MKNFKNVKIAEDINETAYNQISVESFGELMLEGMKKASQNNYLNNKRKAPELIEFEVRNSRRGLGYVDEEEEEKKKNFKEPKSFYGENIKIIDGEFKGKMGKILMTKKYLSFKDFLNDNDRVLIELNINGQKLEIKNSLIELVPYDLILKEKKLKEKEKSHNNSQKDEQNVKKEIKKEKLKWIKPNIIIRIIKENSKYYNTKAKVEDILSEDTFSLITNDNTFHTEFSENDCETYIPKLNNIVLILNGEYENKRGILLLRNKSKDIVNVQLLDDLTTVILTQDDICAVP